MPERDESDDSSAAGVADVVSRPSVTDSGEALARAWALAASAMLATSATSTMPTMPLREEAMDRRGGGGGGVTVGSVGGADAGSGADPVGSRDKSDESSEVGKSAIIPP